METSEGNKKLDIGLTITVVVLIIVNIVLAICIGVFYPKCEQEKQDIKVSPKAPDTDIRRKPYIPVRRPTIRIITTTMSTTTQTEESIPYIHITPSFRNDMDMESTEDTEITYTATISENITLEQRTDEVEETTFETGATENSTDEDEYIGISPRLPQYMATIFIDWLLRTLGLRSNTYSKHKLT